jgi:hypothetical protein
MRVGPIQDILTVMFTGGLNHFVSNGNNYRHDYTRPYFFTTMIGNYRNLQLLFQWEIIPGGRFYGETLNGGEKAHILTLSYNNKDMRFGIGMINPFLNNYRLDTENRSAYASYKKSMYTNDVSRMCFFTISYNINFGRVFQSGQKKLNNADNDAGVMTVGK